MKLKIEKDHGDEESKEEINGDEQSKNLGVLKAGNYFGEMALVSDVPRSATVTAVERSLLLSVDKESFGTIFASNSNALAEFSLRLLRGSAELKHLLAHSLGKSAFQAFMQRSHAEENVDFWTSVRDFKHDVRGGSLTENELFEAAKIIFDKYCKEGSEHQVNLPCSMRSVLQTAFDEKDIKADLFDASMDEIYRLMERDNYAKFKRTPGFKEFFKCLGIFAESGDG
jgi:hypothetical protein